MQKPHGPKQSWVKLDLLFASHSENLAKGSPGFTIKLHGANGSPDSFLCSTVFATLNLTLMFSPCRGAATFPGLQCGRLKKALQTAFIISVVTTNKVKEG